MIFFDSGGMDKIRIDTQSSTAHGAEAQGSSDGCGVNALDSRNRRMYANQGGYHRFTKNRTAKQQAAAAIHAQRQAGVVGEVENVNEVVLW